MEDTALPVRLGLYRLQFADHVRGGRQFGAQSAGGLAQLQQSRFTFAELIAQRALEVNQLCDPLTSLRLPKLRGVQLRLQTTHDLSLRTQVALTCGHCASQRLLRGAEFGGALL